jgi:Concanavalin A-like lectin/glucanases superfamily
VMRLLTVVCAIAVALGTAAAALAAFSAITSNASTFSANPDLSNPTVTASIIARPSGLLPGKIRQGGQYYVYANATDAGNPPSGISTVAANTTTFDTGTGSVALTTAGGPWTVNAVSYAYRSALLTANTPLVTGTSYVYTVTANDNASHTSGATNFNVTIETYAEVISAMTGLVSYWKLNEGAGTNAADSAGANTGTYTNTPTLGQAGALTGDTTTSVSFNGTNEYVNVPDAASLRITGSITIEAWIRSNTLINNSTILSKGSTTGYRLMRNGNTNPSQFGTSGPTNGNLNGTASINDGVWHHIVAVYDGANKYIYLDGVQDATVAATGAITTAATALRIAENAQATGRYWAGWIDEVSLYNVALTPAEVLDHYNAGKGTG